MDTPNINEFIAHPDYQQIAAFFLGAVFITSLNYSYLWIRGFFPRFGQWMYRNRSASITSSLNFVRPGENQSLVFTLSLCFAFASIAYFGSLLSFSPNGGATCAFVVAWGGMAAQTARLIGLVILLLELKDLGIAKLEFYLALASIFVAMVLVFVNNAIGTGAIRLFGPLSIAVCYRKHFLPTALATSFMHISLELFMFLRLGFFIMQKATLAGQRSAVWRDGRIVKAISLLFLELLVIVPSAIHISLIADFVPLSVGALAVLVAFNDKSTARESNPILKPDGVSPITVAPIPPTGGTGWFSRRSFRSSFSPNNLTRAPISPEPVPHKYLNGTTAAWPRQVQRQTPRLSTTETMSTHEGVVQTVARSATPARARVVLVTSAEIETMPKTATQQPSNVPPRPVTSAPETATAEPQMLAPSAPSPSLSPTSILLHPWHERRQAEGGPLTSGISMDGSEELKVTKSPMSARRGSERTSYMYQGYTFPRPPVTSAAPIRRYSSATLTSPMFSQDSHGGEGGPEPRQHVQLLTFESNFRTRGERIAHRTPLPSVGALRSPG
ncbi:hypothetical protein FPV67DRAFT_1471650 [Lyophyllum atratum]|nr:hypothetical protein FPV67DRAFT_1471650 [Lyophyllum atratum]